MVKYSFKKLNRLDAKNKAEAQRILKNLKKYLEQLVLGAKKIVNKK